jgi:predicted esterase YcpF (UPF0227 family)
VARHEKSATAAISARDPVSLCGLWPSGTMPVQRKASMIVYIHGFNSSPASHKANQLRERLAGLGREDEFACPALPHWPRDAMALLEREVSRVPADQVTLVGSSLGGFYATYLTEKFGMRSVLVNPAITPHDGLRAYLGPQKNLYSGDEYVLTEEHLVQLAGMHVPKPARMDSYLLLHTTGDELLDWRVAVDHYRDCRQVIVQGSDHGFREFSDYIDIVFEFLSWPDRKTDARV